MLDSHKSPSVEPDWCEFLNVVGHSDKLKEGRMLKARTNALRSGLHLDTGAKDVLLRSCIQKYAFIHTN